MKPSRIVISGLVWCRDDAPDQVAASFRDFKWQQRQKMIRNRHYSTNIATADFVLFHRVKSELADLSLSQKSFMTSL
jgi:hypothetical protein